MRKIASAKKFNKRKKFKDQNVGLHCHCKETVDHLRELLKRAKQEGVTFLSINNYKSLKIFKEIVPKLTGKDLEDFKNIKLIPSIEMPGRFNFTNVDGEEYNIEIHILGYGVDLEKEELLKKFVDTKYRELDQEEELKRLIEIGHELGLVFDDEEAYLDSEDDNRKYAGRAFMQALRKNMDSNFCEQGEVSKTKLPFELRESWRAFQNRCVKDFKSPFYLDLTSLNPDIEGVLQLIHQMGGKAYLAHPSAYFAKKGTAEEIQNAYDNTVELGRQFINRYGKRNKDGSYIDGIEVYHPSYQGNIEVIGKMKELVGYHRKGSVGGTDIHIDETIASTETVSSNSLGTGRIHLRNLRKISFLTRKARSIKQIKEIAIKDSNYR